MGTATADAQTLQIDPRQAELSVGISIGQADATYTNATSRASSQGINLGVIGTTLGVASCGGAAVLPLSDQPQALSVDSRDPGAAAGKTANTYGLIDQSAKANGTPSSTAVTTIRSIGIPGVLSIGSGMATASTSFINNQRVAKATVDLSSISLPGGITFSGLHWEVTHVSGGSDKPKGVFTVNQASGPFAALSPLLAGLNPFQLLSQISSITGPLLGIQVTLPKVHLDNDVLFVDPLVVSVVPNKNRDAISGALLTGIQPLRSALFGAVLKAVCQAGSVITVADIALGSVTGAGSLNLRLGGVQASTSDVSLSDFLNGGGDLGGGDVATGDTSTGDLGSGSALGSGLGSPDLGGSAPGAATTGSTPKAKKAASKSKLPKGARGGALLGIGLIILAALAAMAEADRRKLQKAQHRIPEGGR